MSSADVRQGRQNLGIVLMVVGVVALGAGIWGVSAKSQAESSYSNPAVAFQMAFSDSARSSAVSSLNTMSAVGTVGLVAGIVCLILGVVVLATLPSGGSNEGVSKGAGS